jgi:hypothetical protein
MGFPWPDFRGTIPKVRNVGPADRRLERAGGQGRSSACALSSQDDHLKLTCDAFGVVQLVTFGE